MNSNGENRFSIREIVLVFLFIALFVFILVWLFPTKGYMKAFDFAGNNTENNEKTNDKDNQFIGLNSMLFNQNLTQMKEAAILYFTTPRLPQNIGDTKKLTLGEMLDMHLVTNIVDMSGNTCDRDASYVLLTKLKDEYTLKVNLKCGDTEEYIIVYIGCYSYCEGDVCQSRTKQVIASSPSLKKAYECEYRLNGRWTDWSKWSAWQTEKPKESSTVQVDKKDIVKGGKTKTKDATTSKKYSCPEGYILDGKKCVKTQTGVRGATKTTTTKCPEGYVIVNGECLRKTTTVRTATKTTTTKCPEGYVIKNGECNRTLKYTRGATKTTTSTCPSGYSYIDGTCKRILKYTRGATKTTTRTCPSGYVISGSSCIQTVRITRGATKTVTSGGVIRETFEGPQPLGVEPVDVYSVRDCSNGCRVITYYVYDIKQPDKVSYSCPSGYTRDGTTCYKTETRTATPTTSTSYSCPSGYTKDGSSCYRLETSYADPAVTVTYSCPSGYTKDGTKCYRTETTTVAATVNVKYSCPEGYGLDGTKCYKTSSQTATPTKTVTYSCPSGYTKDGTKCYRKIVTTVTANEKIIYKCESGYEVSGTKCIKYIGGIRTTYYRYRTRKYIGGNTKWSTCTIDTSLTKKGYILTGNKRLKYSK